MWLFQSSSDFPVTARQLQYLLNSRGLISSGTPGRGGSLKLPLLVFRKIQTYPSLKEDLIFHTVNLTFRIQLWGLYCLAACQFIHNFSTNDHQTLHRSDFQTISAKNYLHFQLQVISKISIDSRWRNAQIGVDRHSLSRHGLSPASCCSSH